MHIIQKYYIIKADIESDANGGCSVGESDTTVEAARTRLKIRVDADACPVNVRHSLERLALTFTVSNSSEPRKYRICRAHPVSKLV